MRSGKLRLGRRGGYLWEEFRKKRVHPWMVHHVTGRHIELKWYIPGGMNQKNVRLVVVSTRCSDIRYCRLD
jgi:hypothetical protein